MSSGRMTGHPDATGRLPPSPSPSGMMLVMQHLELARIDGNGDNPWHRMRFFEIGCFCANQADGAHWRASPGCRSAGASVRPGQTLKEVPNPPEEPRFLFLLRLRSLRRLCRFSLCHRLRRVLRAVIDQPRCRLRRFRAHLRHARRRLGQRRQSLALRLGKLIPARRGRRAAA